MLKVRHQDEYEYEIGIDEAGRGPMFGRLYVAATITPKSGEFKHEWMKDSKRFHSDKKIKQVSDHIKEHATAWAISYVEADVIDQINIRQAVFRGMHDCCRQIIESHPELNVKNTFVLVDGNDFAPYRVFDKATDTIVEYANETVEKGDNTYCSIAAASILAKVARDEYIRDICAEYPDLDEKYGLLKNKGYGTKTHMDGLREHGYSDLHRKTFKVKTPFI
jgi:ribonuclease HII